MPRRDYSKKLHAYRAPRMHVRRDKVKREIVKKRAKAFFLSIVLIGFIGVIGYWLFFSPLFIITDVVVLEDGDGEAGLVAADHREVEAFVETYRDRRVLFIFPGRNFFLFSPETLQNQLAQKHFSPPVQGFVVETHFPHQAFVTFKRRVPRLAVVTRYEIPKTILAEPNVAPAIPPSLPLSGGTVKGESVEVVERTYFADESGTVVRVNPESVLPTLPRVVLHLSSPATFLEYDAILNPTMNGAVFSLVDNLQSPRIKEIEIHSALHDEFIARTEEGYAIYFTLQYPLAKQVLHVQSLLPKIGERQKKEILYIDVRIDSRAYVCCNLSNLDGHPPQR